MVSVTYIGPLADNSGYAEAARGNINALTKVGINVQPKAISFENFRSGLGKKGKLVQNLTEKNKDLKTNIQIIHLTPQNFPRFHNPNKYNIAYTTWETNKLPLEWVKLINSMDEVWVPSQHNVKMFKNSGITIPIFSVPHSIEEAGIETKELTLQGVEEKDFIFYSIFQWLERKNPIAQLLAYLTEFTSDEDVVLVLKTYLMKPGDETQSELIKSTILTIREKVWLPNPPRVLLLTDLLSTGELHDLHRRGDCYISSTRCEGFGLPVAEAALAKNPVVVTGYGAQSELVKHGITGYTTSYMMTPCSGMPWPTYTGKMS